MGDHYIKAQVALRGINSHYRQLHTNHAGTKVQLANAYASSHMLFGCVVWGHSFGAVLSLRCASGSSVRKLDALHRSSLRWAVAAPISICNAALYLLTATLPL